MCFKKGIAYVNGGYRVCILKESYKWTYAIYISANKLVCKRFKTGVISIDLPVQTDIKKLTKRFLAPSPLTNKKRNMTKKVHSILKEILEKY